MTDELTLDLARELRRQWIERNKPVADPFFSNYPYGFLAWEQMSTEEQDPYIAVAGNAIDFFMERKMNFAC